MKPNARANFWIGLVVGAVVAAAVLFSVYYVPRKGLALGRDALGFGVVLPEAHGLHVGSPVLVSGIEAGEVTDVAIRELGAQGYRVLVDVEIFDGERYGALLTTASAYQVARSGLLGEMVLAISPGGGGQPVAGQLVDGVPPADFTHILDDISRISKRLADFMDGREAGDPNLRRALLDLQTAIRNVRDFTGNLPR
ncbi:MAG: MCE family protein [Deltaproteobacteria bacterium]|nr:MAG: MCE family protein [Deltaproteobacteria bacterium]